MRLKEELEQETKLKHFKTQFEDAAKEINKFRTQAQVVQAMEAENRLREEFQQKANAEEIQLKEKQMLELVQLIRSLKEEEKDVEMGDDERKDTSFYDPDPN
mmetsp:Transcript_6086/g.4602  ORF Transcript_6086/g.4602 Transcript_6086/m.4602 type:complete len:102 (+) Transcript_6086:127-432(+)